MKNGMNMMKMVIYPLQASDGYEEWREYDKNGNLIHSKDSAGNEKLYEYNERGNLICYKEIW